MKAKVAGIFLLVASILWACFDLYFLVQRYTRNNYYYYEEDVVIMVLRELQITVPVALILVSIYLMGIKTENEASKIQNSRIDEPIQNNLTIGDWLLNYLIVAIPLVGFIFMILWTTDKENPIRKVWAQASLIWAGIITFISLLFVAAVIS